jgi:hypothetical protein
VDRGLDRREVARDRVVGGDLVVACVARARDRVADGAHLVHRVPDVGTGGRAADLAEEPRLVEVEQALLVPTVLPRLHGG